MQGSAIITLPPRLARRADEEIHAGDNVLHGEQLEQKRLQVGPRGASWPARSWGSAAIKIDVSPTSGPTWRLSHLRAGVVARRDAEPVLHHLGPPEGPAVAAWALVADVPSRGSWNHSEGRRFVSMLHYSDSPLKKKKKRKAPSKWQ
jgi:hypothetical protein